jgi:hypothetical protein
LDENVSDLEQWFGNSPSNDRNDGYHLSPYKSNHWGQVLEHSSFLPHPTKVLEQYRKLECASFMGILPELHR